MDHSTDWMASFEALKSVYSDGTFSNMALNEAIPHHPGCRDSFVRSITKGTIRQTITLDYIIGMLAAKGLKGIKTRTLIILRMGLFAIRCMDSVPDHAAVNEAVALSRKTARGTDKFINAILRSYIRRRDEFEPGKTGAASAGVTATGTNALEVNTAGVTATGADASEVNTAGVTATGADTDGAVLKNAGKRAGASKEAEPPFIAEISDNIKRLSIKHSFPEPIVSLLTAQYGDEAEKILEGLNDPPGVVLRVNTLKTTRDELIEILEKQGIAASPAALLHNRTEGTHSFLPQDVSARTIIAEGRIIDSEAYRQGLFTVQSLSSIMAVEALAPVPESEVLDMCAAPGGKSTMMAELMNNKGRIIACDIHEHRLKLIEASAERTGAKIIETMLSDGTVFDSTLENRFDFVLADVPCSGLGVIGTKPEIRLRTDLKGLHELTGIQLEILKNAFRYAKPGGRICYSTCTLNKDENEGVIHRFMAAVNEGFADVNDGFASIVEMKTILPYNNSIGFHYCIIEKNA